MYIVGRVPEHVVMEISAAKDGHTRSNFAQLFVARRDKIPRGFAARRDFSDAKTFANRAGTSGIFATSHSCRLARAQMGGKINVLENKTKLDVYLLQRYFKIYNINIIYVNVFYFKIKHFSHNSFIFL